MCSTTEIEADVAVGTGCGLDRLRIWTSTVCLDGQGAYSQSGAKKFLDFEPKKCSGKSEKHFVRCCADSKQLLDMADGSASVDYYVDDYDDSDDLLGINTAPYGGFIPPATHTQGLPLVIGISTYFQDPDPLDELKYTASGLPLRSGLSLDRDSGILSGTPSAADVEASPFTLTITATDPSGLTAQSTIELIIQPGKAPQNHPPVSSGGYEAEGVVGIPFFFDLASSFSDSDGDLLQFTQEGLSGPTGLSLDPITGILKGVPKEFDQTPPGQARKIIIIADDGQGGQARAVLKLTVAGGMSYNSPPSKVGDIPLQVATLGYHYELKASPFFTDEGDELTFYLNGFPEGTGFSIDSQTGLVSGIPTLADVLVEPQPIRGAITASDSEGQSTGSVFFVSIVDPRTPPSYSSSSCEKLGWEIRSQTPTACANSFLGQCAEPANYVDAMRACIGAGARLCTSDELSDDVAAGSGCRLDDISVWSSTSCGQDQYFTQAGSAASLNSHPRTCTASSEKRAYRCCADTQNTKPSRMATGVRSSQTIVLPSDIVRAAVGRWSFISLNSDPRDVTGSGDVQFLAQGLPSGSGMSLNSASGLLSGIPNMVDALASPVKLLLRAVSQHGETLQEEQMTLLVSPDTPIDHVNHPPVALPLGRTTAITDQVFMFDASKSFSDSDGDSLTFRIEGLPATSGFRIIPSSGVIFGTPSMSDIGAPQPLQLKLVASDSQLEAVGSLEIFIKRPPTPEMTTNRAPVAGTLEAIDVTEGQWISVDLSNGFWDPEGDPITFSQHGLPVGSGLELDPSTGVISGQVKSVDVAAAHSQPLVISIKAEDIEGGHAYSTLSIFSAKPAASPGSR